MSFAVVWLAPKRDFAVLVCCNQGDETAAPKACDEAAAALIGIVLRGPPIACVNKAWNIAWK
jgi:hypothetical protein